MNPRIKALQTRRAALINEMKASLALAAKEGRELTAEEQAAYTQNETELGAPATDDSAATGLFAKLEREERLARAELEQTKIVPNPSGHTPEQEAELTGIVGKAITFKHTHTPKYFKGDTPRQAALAAYKAGMWFRSVIFGDKLAKQWTVEHGYGVESLAQSSQAPSTGGILVPDELSSAIIDLRELYGVFRQNINVMPMGSETMTIPRTTGDPSAYFVSDTTATTQSQAAFDGVNLAAKELASLVLYPKGLADDAVISLADFLARKIAYAFSVKEDACGFIGDGTSTYGGMVGAAVKINDGTHAGGIYTALAGNTGFETLDMVDFHGVTAKLPQYAKANAKWYISSAGMDLSMSRLAYASGGVTMAEVAGKMVPQFLGYPVVVTQTLNSTAGADVSVIKCLFGDLNLAAAMGERAGFSIDTSDQRYFEFRQIAIQGTERFDINVHSLGTASVAGPLVALKTPGS